jgi:hypothetical protein
MAQNDNNEQGYLYVSTGGDNTYNTGNPTFATTTTWDKSVKPVVAFWFKASALAPSGGNLEIQFQAYSGASQVGQIIRFDVSSYLSSSTPYGNAYVANTWTLVVIDFSDTGNSNWVSYGTTEQAATSVGGFCLRVDNGGNNNWQLAVDDIYVADGI